MARARGEGSWRTRKDGRIEYALPTGKTANGNTKRKFFYGVSKKQVLLQVERWRKENFEFGNIEPNDLTLDEFFERHLEHREIVQRRITALTREDYTLQYGRYIKADLGHLKLLEIKPSHITAWQTRLARRKLSNRTLDYAYRILKSCLEFAARLRLISFNPMAGVPAPRKDRTEKTAFTKDEARQYLEAARPQRLSALFLLVLTTGLRRSELLGLRWQDVNFERLELSVRQRIRWIRGGGFDTSTPKTMRSRRTIPLATDVVVALGQWREQQSLERSYAGQRWRDLDLIFTSQIGNPVHSTTLADAHEAILKRANLRRLTFHELRHSFTSLARAANVDLKVISEVLGHASVAFTADFYQHTFEEMRREVSKTAQELTGSSLPDTLALSQARLELWRGLVEWLVARVAQSAQTSALPKRFYCLVAESNTDERLQVGLIVHVKRSGWCPLPDYSVRLRELEAR